LRLNLSRLVCLLHHSTLDAIHVKHNAATKQHSDCIAEAHQKQITGPDSVYMPPREGKSHENTLKIIEGTHQSVDAIDDFVDDEKLSEIMEMQRNV
jgi:hypothetical protein